MPDLIRAARKTLEVTLSRDMLTVAGGTGLAQIVAIVFLPILTRLYDPEAFGIQSVFMSLVGIIAIIATLGYPMAIVLAKNTSNARAVTRLSILLGFTISAVLLVYCHLFPEFILATLNLDTTHLILYLAPLAVMATILRGTLDQWLSRMQEFKLTAQFTFLTTLTINLLKAAWGTFSSLGITLVVTNTLGSFLGLFLAYFGWKLSRKSAVPNDQDKSPVSLAEVAYEHRDFPLYRTPMNLINMLSQALPVILITSFFGSAEAGHYALAIAILSVPVGLLSGAVSTVLYPKLNHLVLSNKNPYELISETTIGLGLLALLPFALLIVASPILFPIIFGDQWIQSGIYAQLLACWVFLQLVNKPALTAVPILKIQPWLLWYEVFSTATKLLALWLGFWVFNNPLIAIGLYSMAGSVFYVYLILYIFRKSRQFIVTNSYPENQQSS